MFEVWKFKYYVWRMHHFSGAAKKAKRRNGRRVIPLMAKAVKAGHKALNVRSPKISGASRAFVAYDFAVCETFYKSELDEQAFRIVQATRV